MNSQDTTPTPLVYAVAEEPRGRGILIALAVAALALGAIGTIADLSFLGLSAPQVFASLSRSATPFYAYQMLSYYVCQLVVDVVTTIAAIAILARARTAWHLIIAVVIAFILQSASGLTFAIMRQMTALSPTMPFQSAAQTFTQTTGSISRILFYCGCIFLLTRSTVRWFVHRLVMGERWRPDSDASF